MKSSSSPFFVFTRGVVLVALLVLSLAGRLEGAERPLYFVTRDVVDVNELLPPPPITGSPEQLADMAAVVNACHACSSNDLAIAIEQNRDLNAFNLAPFLGVNFKANRLPKTAALLRHAQSDTAQFVAIAKAHWKRLRPSVVDTNLLVIKPDTDFSYPSGHSASATIMALILMELVPDQANPILAASRDAGWHRVQLARHYPSDIQAGRVVAQVLFGAMKKNPRFKDELNAAKQELAAVLNAPVVPLINTTNAPPEMAEPMMH